MMKRKVLSNIIHLAGGEIHDSIFWSFGFKNQGVVKIPGASLRSSLLSTESWLDLAPEFWRPHSAKT